MEDLKTPKFHPEINWPLVCQFFWWEIIWEVFRGNLKHKNRDTVCWEDVVQLVENQTIPILKSMIFQNILVPAIAVRQNENYRRCNHNRHVPKEGSRGGVRPPDFGRSEGAAGSGSAPHYCTPPQIFRLWHMPAQDFIEPEKYPIALII